MSNDLDRELQIMPKCLGCSYHKMQGNICTKKDKCDKVEEDE